MSSNHFLNPDVLEISAQNTIQSDQGYENNQNCSLECITAARGVKAEDILVESNKSETHDCDKSDQHCIKLPVSEPDPLDLHRLQIAQNDSSGKKAPPPSPSPMQSDSNAAEPLDLDPTSQARSHKAVDGRDGGWQEEANKIGWNYVNVDCWRTEASNQGDENMASLQERRRSSGAPIKTVSDIDLIAATESKKQSISAPTSSSLSSLRATTSLQDDQANLFKPQSIPQRFSDISTLTGIGHDFWDSRQLTDYNKENFMRSCLDQESVRLISQVETVNNQWDFRPRSSAVSADGQDERKQESDSVQLNRVQESATDKHQTLIALQQLNLRRNELKLIDQHLIEMISECLIKLEGPLQARTSFSHSGEQCAFEPLHPEAIASFSAPPRPDTVSNPFFANSSRIQLNQQPGLQCPETLSEKAIDLSSARVATGSQPVTQSESPSMQPSLNPRKSRLLNRNMVQHSSGIQSEVCSFQVQTPGARRKRALSYSSLVPSASILTAEDTFVCPPKKLWPQDDRPDVIGSSNLPTIPNYSSVKLPMNAAPIQVPAESLRHKLNHGLEQSFPLDQDQQQHLHSFLAPDQLPARASLSFRGSSQRSSANLDLLMRENLALANSQNHLWVLNEHQKLIAFQCHVCGSGFEDRHRLQQHLSIHLNLQPNWYEETTIKETMAKYEAKRGDYVCTRCSIRFDTTAEFDKHMHLHGDKPYNCELCMEDRKYVFFRYYRQLLTHLRSHCFLYKCKFIANCKQTANRKDYLKLHILKHHLNNKLPEHYTICCH